MESLEISLRFPKRSLAKSGKPKLPPKNMAQQKVSDDFLDMLEDTSAYKINPRPIKVEPELK